MDDDEIDVTIFTLKELEQLSRKCHESLSLVTMQLAPIPDIHQPIQQVLFKRQLERRIAKIKEEIVRRKVAREDSERARGGFEYDVFISFAREDRVHARRLYDELCRSLKPFLDEEAPEGPFDATIPTALEQSRLILILLSDHSAGSVYQRCESARAIDLIRSSNGQQRLATMCIDGRHRAPRERPFGLEIHPPYVPPRPYDTDDMAAEVRRRVTAKRND